MGNGEAGSGGSLDEPPGRTHAQGDDRARLSPGRGSILPAAVVALLTLVLWWGAITWLDGILAQALPYRQYATAALAYPDVYYPGLPGWFLAQVQPFPAIVWVVTLGWLVALSVGIGVVATWLAADRSLSATTWAAAIVGALFVGVTVLEAVVSLVA